MLTYIGQVFDWRSKSACTSADADMFYSDEPADQDAAKAICAGCHTRAECLATAMLRDEPYGIWGGMTPQERSRHAITWTRRMGGRAEIRAMRERTGIYANTNNQHQDRRYAARLRAAKEARAKLAALPTDFPHRDQYVEIIDMIITHPLDDGTVLARRAGLSKTWFNRRKREAFQALGVDESSHYEAIA